MVKQRIIETNEGIQAEFEVQAFNEFRRRMRDKGLIETGQVIECGILQGLALEISSGPGYVGLEWLKRTRATRLKAVEISHAMIEVASDNAHEYGLKERVEYIKGDAGSLPFADRFFEGVFSTDALHEWAEPEKVFNEIHRVLKNKGRFCICDLRRDINPLLVMIMKLLVKPKSIKPGFISSLNAAYTVEEIQDILSRTKLAGSNVAKDAFGLSITGIKQE
ncbi:MAG: class I SAM-dependent methyltransferase [Spirochaetales bacterium]|nr:class I SAM-dependent methyltransferase [Spirochaetales bacterium]